MTLWLANLLRRPAFGVLDWSDRVIIRAALRRQAAVRAASSPEVTLHVVPGAEERLGAALKVAYTAWTRG